MASIARTVVGRTGLVAIGFGAANNEAVLQTARDIFKPASLLELWRSATVPASVAVPPPGETAAVLAALQTATQALEAMAKAQRSGSGSSRALLFWLAAAGGAALAIHHFGWQRIGWVTGEQLTAGLQSVREYVTAQIAELGEAMSLRFGQLEASLTELKEVVQEVGVATAEVREEVAATRASLASLELRMTPLESDAKTAADGVQLLCELVKTSGLLQNASPSALHRLDNFADGEAPPAPRELPPPREPPRPITVGLPSPPSMPAPQLSGLMAAIVSP